MSRLDCYAMVQQQALMHQAMLQQQQQPMYHPGLITAMSQVTPPSLGSYFFLKFCHGFSEVDYIVWIDLHWLIGSSANFIIFAA
jgi:hypothetical protein